VTGNFCCTNPLCTFFNSSSLFSVLYRNSEHTPFFIFKIHLRVTWCLNPKKKKGKGKYNKLYFLFPFFFFYWTPLFFKWDIAAKGGKKKRKVYFHFPPPPLLTIPTINKARAPPKGKNHTINLF
jgi:hypothetical protein